MSEEVVCYNSELLTGVAKPTCVICLCDNPGIITYVGSCNCRPSVHVSCLNTWFSENRDTCLICRKVATAGHQTMRVVETVRTVRAEEADRDRNRDDRCFGYCFFCVFGVCFVLVIVGWAMK